MTDTRPGFETRVAYVGGTPAGYAELESGPGGQVELRSFGLLPAFIGRGIGRYLLSFVLREAWNLGGRWPELPGTRR